MKRVQLIHELWKEFGERIAVCGEVQVDSVVHMRECLELVTETHGRVVGVLHLAGLADLRYVPEVRSPPHVKTQTYSKASRNAKFAHPSSCDARNFGFIQRF